VNNLSPEYFFFQEVLQHASMRVAGPLSMARLEKVPLKSLRVCLFEQAEEVEALANFEVLGPSVAEDLDGLELLQQGGVQQCHPGFSQEVKILLFLGLGQKVEDLTCGFSLLFIVHAHDQVRDTEPGKVVVLGQFEIGFHQKSPSEIFNDEAFSILEFLLCLSHSSGLVVSDFLVLEVIGDVGSKRLELFFFFLIQTSFGNAFLVLGAALAFTVVLAHHESKLVLAGMPIPAVVANAVLLNSHVDGVWLVLQESRGTKRQSFFLAKAASDC